MIKLLERYIAKRIIQATGMAVLIIAAVVLLITLLGELKNIGEGDYGIVQAVLFVIKRMPTELYHFTPVFILLGSVLGLSMLFSHRELMVMRAAGFSVRQVLRSVLGAALLLIMVATLIGEWVAPNLSYIANMQKEYTKNSGQAVVTSNGVWFHIDDNFIHARHVVGHQLMEGVTRYQFDKQHHLLAAYYAKTLTHEKHSWVMNDVMKTTFSHDRTHSEQIPRLIWKVTFNANLLNMGLIDPSEMTLPKLAKFAHYLEHNGLRSSEYYYEFWQRVFQPLASLVMIFLAVPFVLSTMNRMTLGLRMMIGILVGFTFFISNAFLGQLCIVFQIPAALAAFLPLFVFMLAGVIFASKMT